MLITCSLLLRSYQMPDMRKIRGRPLDLDKAAVELRVPKHTLMKYNRPLLQEYAKKVHGEV